MLDIIAIYHCIQLQGQLINLTWENGKKPSLRPYFGLFWPIFGTQRVFFVGFTSSKCYTLLEAIIVCNFEENSWIKLENGKKPSFRPDFGHVGPNLGPKIVFCEFYLQCKISMLDINASYYCWQFQKNPNESNMRKLRKT